MKTKTAKTKAKTAKKASAKSKFGTGPVPPAQQAQAKNRFTQADLDQLRRERMAKLRFTEPLPSPMKPEAYHGLAGEIVQAIEPFSEASKEAILVQLLVGLGNMLGHDVYRDQGAEHYLNEFCVLTGETSIGRKGTAYQPVKKLLWIIDRTWATNCIKGGFATGESIIFSIRDSRAILKGAKSVQDPGVSDKRLLIFEDELARLFAVAARTGNNIFSVIRNGWDSNEIIWATSKTDPIQTSGAHISLIGHITKEELLERLERVDTENGVINRMLWIAAQRSKKIATPPAIYWRKDYSSIVQRLETIWKTFHSGNRREMDFDADGKLAWEKFYHATRPARAGIISMVTNRAEAHVLRLAMLYAALDHICLIQAKHVDAALAVWDYAERSARWIFQNKTGNKIADRILFALKRSHPDGLTRTEISSEILNRNCLKIDLDKAFEALVKADLADMRVEEINGLAIEHWTWKPI